MDFMTYPTVSIVEGRGLIPNISLPIEFERLVSSFYREGRRETVERYREGIEKLLKERGKPLDIRLQWDERKGLTNISVGAQGGLELNDLGGVPFFQEHNLGWRNGWMAGFIAMKYVSELLKSS
jgi:hypothetical protein